MRNLPRKVLTQFWNRVDICQEADCWPWTGNISDQGYGIFNYPVKQRVKAHRLSYELVRGTIPSGVVPDHLCRNRWCVNPYHLELVPIKENVLRGVGITAKNKVKTHCKNGHEFTPENTLVFRQAQYNGTGRECRTCNLAKQKRWKAKKKAIRALAKGE